MPHLQSGLLGVPRTTIKWVLVFVFLELSSLHISLLYNNLSSYISCTLYIMSNVLYCHTCGSIHVSEFLYEGGCVCVSGMASLQVQQCFETKVLDESKF